MKSFSLLRTNVGLTTNIKIIIGSNYNLSLDSIDSSSELSLDKYKNVSFNKKNYYDELIPYFYKDTPIEIAYRIKYDDDVDTMSDDFSNQYDEIYQYGARNIVNNKNYEEEYEYFAPLYLSNGLPKKFIIFRSDGPGLGVLSKDNFNTEIINNLKVIKLFDLTKESPFGQWLDLNFTNNDYFPKSPLEMDFRNLEFSIWNGIDYETGGYTSKSRFIDDIIDEEKEIFELEKFIFDSYKENKIVFPSILNFSFLFDDTPSTPEVKRKWSLNRYFGFYVDDMEIVSTISPYITPILKNDVIVEDDNILYSIEGDPFIEGWTPTRPFYVEYNGMYYKVEKFEEEGAKTLQAINSDKKTKAYVESYAKSIITKYRIISDINLTGKENKLNQNFGLIDENNKLIDYNINDIQISGFEDADVWLIKIDGIYHNLVNDNGSIKILSDYSFEFNQNDFTYTIAGSTTKVTTIVDFDNEPKKFNIYKLKFSDIKDFDDRIIDTEYSKYEYEKETELTFTDETKMYMEDLLSNSDPKDLDDFNYKNKITHIPVSSEYTANYETFKIENNNLSEIWRKNPIYCRWGYQNSTSANDYPYLLNNSDIFENFNRTTNTIDPRPNRSERNLDYFYTINSSTSSYLHHSLHIEKLDINGDIDNGFKFELDKYLNIATYSVGTTSATYSFDYFSSIFDRNAYFNNSKIKKNVKKYSELNKGDKSIPNNTLFRGIEFSFYDVESITLNNSDVESINLKTSNKLDNYKFSILLSDNEFSIDTNGNIINSNNIMTWNIIEDWKMDNQYNNGDIVIFDDILYKSSSSVITMNPVNIISGRQYKSAPYNQTSWNFYNPTDNIFWSPTGVYATDDYIYNHGDYYIYNSTGIEDFWNPSTASTTGYNLGDVVLYRGNYYISMINYNRHDPNYRRPFVISDNYEPYGYWVATQSSNPKWNTIDLWNPSISYTIGTSPTFVVHNEIIYKSNSTYITNRIIESGNEPGVSKKWSREYSLSPDTNIIYSSINNPIISMNNRYYLSKSNDSNSTLDNGIIIYINEKWKNILININISDNTLPNISETDRDDIYGDLYSKITAYNFIESINNISNKNGYSDHITYVIIKEDGTISKHNYSNNINTLPYMIKCSNPDEFKTKIYSLKKTPIVIPSQLNLTKKIVNGKINTTSKLNYFNDIPIAANIIENKFRPKVFENYSGNRNIVSNTIYRFTGYYMPVFYDIQLFEKDSEFKQSGNYKFDTSLTEFGIMKERKIRKINRKGSVLKLSKYDDIKSIYPMGDEFGYTTKDFFIFSSTWDFKYHSETIVPILRPTIKISQPMIAPINIGTPFTQQNTNLR